MTRPGRPTRNDRWPGRARHSRVSGAADPHNWPLNVTKRRRRKRRRKGGLGEAVPALEWDRRWTDGGRGTGFGG